MTDTRRLQVEALPGFKWQFGALGREEQQDMARAIEQLAEGKDVPRAERVGGTRHLYRWPAGRARLLFVQEGDRMLLVTIEFGRAPAARRRRHRAKPDD